MTTDDPRATTTVTAVGPDTVTAAPVVPHPIQTGGPRLARGLVWSDVVAEMERDHGREQLRRAA
jgi:hypothetical protein